MKKRGMILASALLTCSLMLSACGSQSTGQSASSQGIADEVDIASKDLVRAASEVSFVGAYYMEYLESGCVYIDESRFMHYFEYETGEDYILCTQSNCQHKDDSCAGMLESIKKLAYYDGMLYAFVYTEDTNTYDLIEMTIGGEGQKKLASIDAGEYGDWFISEFAYNEVYFGYGNAYVELAYDYYESVNDNGVIQIMKKIQLLVIDLSSGESEVICEVEGAEAYTSLEFQSITEDCIVIREAIAPDVLVGAEVEAAIAAGEYSDIDAMWNALSEEEQQEYADEEYFFYTGYVVYNQYDQLCELLLYDVESGELTTLCSETATCFYDEEDNVEDWTSTCDCLGWYNDKLILRFVDCETEDRVVHMAIYQWDLSGTEMELLYEGEDMNMSVSFFGSVETAIKDDGIFYYFENLEDGETMQVNCMNLATGESEALFVDSTTQSFRILYEGQEFYLGEIPDSVNTWGVYMISKSDYQNANWDGATMLINLAALE